MNKLRSFYPVLLLFLFLSCAVSRYTTEISRDDLYKHVSVLASDELQGRLPGTYGDQQADEYIREQFETAGLESSRQEFGFLKALQPGNENYLQYNGIPVSRALFSPCSFSHDTSVQATLVFAGYGLKVTSDSVQWNDYEGIDVQNKWVMILTGYPDISEYDSYFAVVSEERDKAMLALDQGAAGVLFVSGDETEDSLNKVMMKQADVSIPCFQLLRRSADSILNSSGQTIREAIQSIHQQKKPFSYGTSIVIHGRSDIDRIQGLTGNRYAILEGSDQNLRNEYVIIGAHYDHLGLGGKGSASRYQDTIAVHNGADDNASGVSVLLELASRIHSRKDEIRRSLIFVAFGGEELGLLGSKYFVQHLPVSLKQVSGMINLDMVGRLDTTKGLQIGGAGTSVQADSMIRFANQGGLKLRITRDGSGPSDHSSFYSQNIPVFFLTTGAHTDYHTPYDDVERINFGGLKAISDFSEQLVIAVANNNEPLTFREAGPRESENPGRRFKVTLGFMPDFSAADIDGVRVDIVTKGKAAEKAGIMNGDIIVAIDGTKVHNIYDYMYRLTHLKKNQIISVEVIRNGASEVVIVQL